MISPPIAKTELRVIFLVSSAQVLTLRRMEKPARMRRLISFMCARETVIVPRVIKVEACTSKDSPVPQITNLLNLVKSFAYCS